MNSYISSFKPVLIALAIIGLIEVVYASSTTTSPVERTSYLNFNYGQGEFAHKVIIYEKLLNAVRDQPNVIQIGDSAGMHSVDPRIVEQYLGGLTFHNISCCANMTFEGYYAVLDFMLRHDPSIKAVVLYMTLMQAPANPDAMAGQIVGGFERLRLSFSSLGALVSPPTLGARPDLVRWIYTLGNALPQWGLLPFEESMPALTRILRENRGWWPEHDPHLPDERQAKMIDEVCRGPKGASRANMDARFDVFGTSRSYADIEFRRLADLARRHDIKLIIITQPTPCDEFGGNLLTRLRSDIAKVAAHYPNVVVSDPGLFEHWPSQWYTTGEHLRVGREEELSRRAGRYVARALGLPEVDPPRLPKKTEVPVWSATEFSSPPWRVDGVKLVPQANGDGALLTEEASSGVHEIELLLPDLDIGTYHISAVISGAMSRKLYFQILSPLKPPYDHTGIHCSTETRLSWRTYAGLDSEMELLPDGKFRCWGKFELLKKGARIAVGFSATEYHTGLAYQGDGKSAFHLHRLELSVEK
jgi:hypothetical protein